MLRRESEEEVSDKMDKYEIARQHKIRESRKKGWEAAEILTRGLNGSTGYEDEALIKGFVEGLTRTHRTLQQKSVKAIYAVLKAWAEDCEKGDYDLRNKKK